MSIDEFKRKIYPDGGGIYPIQIKLENYKEGSDKFKMEVLFVYIGWKKYNPNLSKSFYGVDVSDDSFCEIYGVEKIGFDFKIKDSEMKGKYILEGVGIDGFWVNFKAKRIKLFGVFH